MTARLSRQEKKRLAELETTGVYIDEVYGTGRSSSLLLCLSKAVIIFLVCSGTVIGFADAFSLNYKKGTVILFTAFVSMLISLLYVRKKFFYIGYVALLIVFTVELLRYYLYANSGFQAIMNTVREAYAEHFGMSVVRNAEETYVNRNVTITIALIFIIVFLVIMYNITISRYMNFAETFGISFIILQIPLYIGYKPPLTSVIILAAGCICTGILQRGSFNRVTIPGKNSPDYIPDRFFGRNYYTTRGSHRGILTAVLFSLIASFILCIMSAPAYDNGLGETPEDSAKAAVDDSVKILVQNGLNGFFNRYDSLNGLARGVLGGVSSVRPDFQTDLVVSFVPYSNETVYLPGFVGVYYTGMKWDSYVNLSSVYGMSYIDYTEDHSSDSSMTMLSQDAIKKADNSYLKEVLSDDNASAKMQINYVDMSFGLQVSPYITFPEDISQISSPMLPDTDDDKDYNNIQSSKEMNYIPLAQASYKNDEPAEENIDSEELKVTYYDYVYGICTSVPYSLREYLAGFLKEHRYLDLDIRAYLRGDYYDAEEINEFRLNACREIEKMFLKEYPYTLSPGKTPTNGDFVRYFLEEQRRGYCSHFASSAVMLLRTMGIPARYVEGYCIPASLISEEGVQLSSGGDEWFEGDNEYNPEKRLCSVKVSDYYAHAWIEVYLEGKGFVPYEVTPPSFEAIPDGTEGMSGIGLFFSRLMNVDLGIGNSSESDLAITGEITQAVMEKSDIDLSIIFVPLSVIILISAFCWFMFILIRKLIREGRYKKYLREENYRPLVYGRYEEFVKKLKRKKIVNTDNPLPKELVSIIAEYHGVGEEEYRHLSDYVEKVLYSSETTGISEYNAFYGFIRNFSYSKKNT